MKNNIFSEFKTVEALDEEKRRIDEAYAERKKVVELVSEAISLGDKSFGYMKEAFESLSPELYKSKAGRKLIGSYVSTIKNSKPLSALYSIYETIRKANKDFDSDYLVNNISETVNLNDKTLNNAIGKVGSILSEAYIIVGSDIAKNILPQENTKLYESINYLAGTKSNVNNLYERSKCVKVIKEYIENNNYSDEPAPNIDEIANKMLEDFNQKYSGELTEEESKFVKELSESVDNESAFNKYKELCFNKLEEQKSSFEASGDNESANKIMRLQESLSKKQYSSETFSDDVINLFEMSKLFD